MFTHWAWSQPSSPGSSSLCFSISPALRWPDMKSCQSGCQNIKEISYESTQSPICSALGRRCQQLPGRERIEGLWNGTAGALPDLLLYPHAQEEQAKHVFLKYNLVCRGASLTSTSPLITSSPSNFTFLELKCQASPFVWRGFAELKSPLELFHRTTKIPPPQQLLKSISFV
ncbi:uncharacterized protein LOC116274518 [Papio anubis]|uniref:uncharacterized protein LOC116274518 n=1 Tax=Papio anubis TaxID=9555 RepID=UPI0012AD9E58|nr:uncharacterized protein LOC116274518 [Papio anubis]